MLHLIGVLIVVGFALYLINQFIPMQAGIKNLLNIVVIVALVVFVLNVFGILEWFDVPIPRLGHRG